MKIDTVNQRIIALLQQDGRMSYQNISEQVGLTDTAVKRRIKKMQQEGIIRIAALIDPAKTGSPVQAIIGVNTEPGCAEKIADQVAELPETMQVTVTAGNYDVIVQVSLPSDQELHHFLQKRLGALTGITRTQTFYTLSVKKALTIRRPKAEPSNA